MGFDKASGLNRINDPEKAHEMAKVSDKVRREDLPGEPPFYAEEIEDRVSYFYEKDNLSKKTDQELRDIFQLIQIEMANRAKKKS